MHYSGGLLGRDCVDCGTEREEWDKFPCPGPTPKPPAGDTGRHTAQADEIPNRCLVGFDVRLGTCAHCFSKWNEPCGGGSKVGQAEGRAALIDRVIREAMEPVTWVGPPGLGRSKEYLDARAKWTRAMDEENYEAKVYASARMAAAARAEDQWLAVHPSKEAAIADARKAVRPPQAIIPDHGEPVQTVAPRSKQPTVDVREFVKERSARERNSPVSGATEPKTCEVVPIATHPKPRFARASWDQDQCGAARQRALELKRDKEDALEKAGAHIPYAQTTRENKIAADIGRAMSQDPDVSWVRQAMLGAR